jgi:hypothetical protein
MRRAPWACPVPKRLVRIAERLSAHSSRSNDQIVRAAPLTTAVYMREKPSMRLRSRHVVRLDRQSLEHPDEKLAARRTMGRPRQLNPGTQFGNGYRGYDKIVILANDRGECSPVPL